MYFLENEWFYFIHMYKSFLHQFLMFILSLYWLTVICKWLIQKIMSLSSHWCSSTEPNVWYCSKSKQLHSFHHLVLLPYETNKEKQWTTSNAMQEFILKTKHYHNKIQYGMDHCHYMLHFREFMGDSFFHDAITSFPHIVYERQEREWYLSFQTKENQQQQSFFTRGLYTWIDWWMEQHERSIVLSTIDQYTNHDIHVYKQLLHHYKNNALNVTNNMWLSHLLQQNHIMLTQKQWLSFMDTMTDINEKQ